MTSGSGASVDPGDGEIIERAIGRRNDVAARLETIRARITEAGGDVDGVRVVAVTKTFGPDAVLAAVMCGIGDIGENYAAELVAKAVVVSRILPALGEQITPVNWHFLGPLQRNKINRLGGVVSLYEGVDRFEAGLALAKRAPGANVLVEVNTSNVPGRPGVLPEQVGSIVDRLRDLDLRVEGLMTVAPPGGGEGARQAFETVATLKGKLQLKEASMGMSDDLELAVAQGATIVRIGRALFGVRQPVSQ